MDTAHPLITIIFQRYDQLSFDTANFLVHQLLSALLCLYYVYVHIAKLHYRRATRLPHHACTDD